METAFRTREDTMTTPEMVPLTVEIPAEDMERLSQITARKAPELGLRLYGARSVLVRQMLREYLDRAEAELGLGREPLAAA